MRQSPYFANLFICASLLLLQPNPALADAAPKLQATMQLTQIAREKWLAEYVFSEPVLGLAFEKVGDYRQRAWKAMAPDMQRREKTDNESFSAPAPTTRLRFEISSYGGKEPNNYAPNIRFSDGGANLYIGFFHGKAMQAQGERELALKTTFQGLPGETLIAPPQFSNSDQGDFAYAYFGPQTPVMAGNVKMIIDPILPAWVRDIILNGSTASAQYYEKTYQRKLSRPLTLSIAVADLEADGFSLSGGASNGQISYRLSGKLAKTSAPEMQAQVLKVLKPDLIVAHEMAHIWQNDVTSGGIGEEAPWVHEGGADVMAADALLNTGRWSKAQYDAFLASSSKECDGLKNTPDAYRYHYACGVQNFVNLRLDIPTLWQALMLETEKTGKVYSAAMVNQVAARLRSAINP